jgi:hypothetical protein
MVGQDFQSFVEIYIYSSILKIVTWIVQAYCECVNFYLFGISDKGCLVASIWKIVLRDSETDV